MKNKNNILLPSKNKIIFSHLSLLLGLAFGQTLTFEIMNDIFFMKFWFWLKQKKYINVCYFQVIKIQTNHDYLFHQHRQ